MRGRLVAGNWKSNGNLESNQCLLDAVRGEAPGLRGVECALCVPYPYLYQARQTLAGTSVTWGAQDVSPFGAGAYTVAVMRSPVIPSAALFSARPIRWLPPSSTRPFMLDWCPSCVSARLCRTAK